VHPIIEDGDEFVLKEYAVKLWKANEQTVDRWIREGYLTAYRIPGMGRNAPVRLLKSEVDALFQPVAQAVGQ
jgi:hypothetical protein